MGVLNEIELEQRLSSNDNLCNSLGSGRTIGAKNIPDKLRLLIGVNAHLEPAKAVADAFGIAPITAHLAKKSEAHPEVKKEINNTLEAVKEDALHKLMVTMGAIKDDDLKLLSGVKRKLNAAKELATIIDKVTPKEKVQTDGAKILIYAPVVKEAKEFEAIEVQVNG